MIKDVKTIVFFRQKIWDSIYVVYKLETVRREQWDCQVEKN